MWIDEQPHSNRRDARRTEARRLLDGGDAGVRIGDRRREHPGAVLPVRGALDGPASTVPLGEAQSRPRVAARAAAVAGRPPAEARTAGGGATARGRRRPRCPALRRPPGTRPPTPERRGAGLLLAEGADHAAPRYGDRRGRGRRRPSGGARGYCSRKAPTTLPRATAVAGEAAAGGPNGGRRRYCSRKAPTTLPPAAAVAGDAAADARAARRGATARGGRRRRCGGRRRPPGRGRRYRR